MQEFFSLKEKPSLISLISNTKSEKHDYFHYQVVLLDST